MRKTHLFLLVGVAVFSVVIFGLNLKLHRVNRHLKRQLDAQIQYAKLTSAPAPGWVMPPLKAKRLDGSAGDFNLQGSAPKITLLLFNPVNCPVCEANWIFWDRLFADPDSKYRFVLLTGADSIPKDYVERHDLTHHALRISVDPGILKQMRMKVTPQTIYVEGGTVKKVWFGLLSDADVKEINNEMKVED